MSKKKRLPIGLYVLLALFTVGLYIFEVVVQKKPPTENLARFLLLLAASVLGIVRTVEGRRSPAAGHEPAEGRLGTDDGRIKETFR